jgi:hypothetical protein
MQAERPFYRIFDNLPENIAKCSKICYNGADDLPTMGKKATDASGFPAGADLQNIFL